jgi:2-dehydro-3-deoxygalactonokinase
MEYNRFPKAQLLHRLFECRSRTLCSEIEPPLAAAFLSGLLIASDVHGALATLRRPAANEVVTLIGAPELTALYATALAKRSCAARQIDGAAAALAGLIDVKRQLSRRIAVYAS